MVNSRDVEGQVYLIFAWHGGFDRFGAPIPHLHLHSYPRRHQASAHSVWRLARANMTKARTVFL